MFFLFNFFYKNLHKFDCDNLFKIVFISDIFLSQIKFLVKFVLLKIYENENDGENNLLN